MPSRSLAGVLVTKKAILCISNETHATDNRAEQARTPNPGLSSSIFQSET